ncbi:hypothetical protein [Gilvimarinus algae]|uniref:Lipoprotein n=1 Tax=Gilvimarinus algae TaxID=3058037 RepID=A0ABT8TN73_9GAMM|nr:hypothetical protein [Gilvimarinus sp. SDUM040014]MDO3383847.1 hypothetical protein [Gilvimarinus sp. SDUM040014]
MKGKLTATIILPLLLIACAKNEEGETRMLSPQDITAIAIQEKAKYVVKDMEFGGQKVDTEHFDKRIERIKKYGRDEALRIEREETHLKLQQSRQRLMDKAKGKSAREDWVHYQSEDKIVALKDTPIPKPNRSLKECIKPNSVIDDDVIRCTRWEIDKSW